MKIKDRPISELIFAEYNPRELTSDQHQQLKDSLTRFGIVDPVIINTHKDRKDIIVGGHQRTKVWKEMGNKEIPTIEVNLNPEKERELNIRLNKNSGQWDWEALTEHFDTDKLVEWGFDGEEIGEWGLNPDELNEDFSLNDGDKPPFQQITFTLSDKQAEIIQNAITEVKNTEEYKYVETFGNENSNGNALYLLITQWVEQKKYA